MVVMGTAVTIVRVPRACMCLRRRTRMIATMTTSSVQAAQLAIMPTNVYRSIATAPGPSVPCRAPPELACASPLSTRLESACSRGVRAGGHCDCGGDGERVGDGDTDAACGTDEGIVGGAAGDSSGLAQSVNPPKCTLASVCHRTRVPASRRARSGGRGKPGVKPGASTRR